MGAGVAPHPSSHFSSPPSRSVLLFHAARPIRRIPRNHGAGFLNPQKAQRSRARKSSIAYLSPPGNLPRAPFFLLPDPAVVRRNPEITGQVAETVTRAQFSWAQEFSCAHLPSSGIAPAPIFPTPGPTALRGKLHAISQAPKSLAHPRTRGSRNLPSNISLLPESPL